MRRPCNTKCRMTNAYKILIRKPEGKKAPFWRLRRRWKDNIKTNQ
jgi:hypothetical protein